jgi:hypothetical protein
MNKREFTKSLKEYRPDLKITTKEITYFYNVYKDLVKLNAQEPERFEQIKKTYRYTFINVRKFRDLLCSQLLIELTPRQAELYIDVVTLVLSDRHKK